MKLKFPRGDQFPLELPVTDEDGFLATADEIDEITLTCRKEPNATSAILFQKKLSDGSITYDEDSGMFVAWIMREDTCNLDYDFYGFDIEVKSLNTITTTAGTIKLTDEYTMGE